MSDELEKRLRELLDCMAMQATGGQLWLDELVHRAARIGAEIEREACAAWLEALTADKSTTYTLADLAAVLRVPR